VLRSLGQHEIRLAEGVILCVGFIRNLRRENGCVVHAHVCVGMHAYMLGMCVCVCVCVCVRVRAHVCAILIGLCVYAMMQHVPLMAFEGQLERREPAVKTNKASSRK
jgi:hypothetical protein